MNVREKNITEEIKEKALEIGFDLIGITSAKPFFRAKKKLKNRKLSDFVNKDINLLTTPSLHLDSAKTIISLALSYAVSPEILEDFRKEEQAYIALYARGQDYHKVMKEKQEELIEYIYNISPDNMKVKLRAYCDTGKLLEREAAYRAGLGWIGKNNNLINPEYGSYLFLGEIITNLDLKTDSPIQGRCNNCDLCIKKCPGKAFNSPYEFEPEKCISFLTQKKGIIDKEQRTKINYNLWGCDTCLQVCPYNKDIPVNLHPEFRPVLKGDIKKVLNFNKGNIERRWLESALSWRGLRVLKRNALICIANNGDEKYIPVLEKEIKNNSPLLRMYAVWALEKIDGPRAYHQLRERLKVENDKRVIKEIKDILKRGDTGDKSRNCR